MNRKIFQLGILSLLLAACSTTTTSSSNIFSIYSSSDYSSEDNVSLTSSLESSESLSQITSEELSSSNLSYSSAIYENSHESIPFSSFSSETSIEEEEPLWDVDFELSGLDFRNHLKSLIDEKRTQTTTYSDCLTIGANAAAYPNRSSSTFVPFYHGTTTLARTSSCNREHTWPNSRGSGKTGPGADPFIIRPTLTSDNTSRGNYFYGVGGSSKMEWDPASLGYEPSRGEAARVILYAATAYYDVGLSLSNNPSDATGLKTMGTLKYLIQWNKKYEPTEMEIRINNYLDSKGYGRNPFVDNPSFADYIWNENGVVGSTSSPEDQTTNEYELVDALEDIDGLNLAIVTKDSAGTPMGLTSNEKSDSLPWYLLGVVCSMSDDNKAMTTEYEALAFYYFEQQLDGTYTIKNNSNYLINYVDGTHYSIGLGKTPSNNGSIYWNITSKGDGSFVFYGKAGVYLEYYKGSFCGYNNEPPEAIYLYK